LPCSSAGYRPSDDRTPTPSGLAGAVAADVAAAQVLLDAGVDEPGVESEGYFRSNLERLAVNGRARRLLFYCLADGINGIWYGGT